MSDRRKKRQRKTFMGMPVIKIKGFKGVAVVLKRQTPDWTKEFPDSHYSIVWSKP